MQQEKEKLHLESPQLNSIHYTSALHWLLGPIQLILTFKALHSIGLGYLWDTITSAHPIRADRKVVLQVPSAKELDLDPENEPFQLWNIICS